LRERLAEESDLSASIAALMQQIRDGNTKTK